MGDGVGVGGIEREAKGGFKASELAYEVSATGMGVSIHAQPPGQLLQAANEAGTKMRRELEHRRRLPIPAARAAWSPYHLLRHSDVSPARYREYELLCSSMRGNTTEAKGWRGAEGRRWHLGVGAHGTELLSRPWWGLNYRVRRRSGCATSPSFGRHTAMSSTRHVAVSPIQDTYNRFVEVPSLSIIIQHIPSYFGR